MESFPKRKEQSIFAEILIKYQCNDLFIFIEDTKMPSVYKKIINRICVNKKIGKIYSAESKENVLKKFVEWKNKHQELKKCIFIVDKDFDSFKGTSLDNHGNLIELERYTIENYLISKNATIALMQTKIFKKNIYELEEILDWDNWVHYIFNAFKRLFIGYVLAHKYELCKNCSISPYVYLIKNSGSINEDKIIDYLDELEILCKQHSHINFETEFVAIDNSFSLPNGYDFHSLIKGKYLFAALLKHLNQITNIKFDDDMSALILADNVDLSKFKFMADKIGSVLSNDQGVLIEKGTKS